MTAARIPVRRTLHLAAMPFPSPQGTQAAVRAMVDALEAAGREAHLVTYGYGTPSDAPPPRRWHRLPDNPPLRSLRSGPSLGKVLLDARLVWSTRALAARLRPDLVVAHHVEACAAAIAAGVAPVLFVAHTALEPELPLYLPSVFGRGAASVGLALDRWLAGRADVVAAVSPDLAAYFAARVGRPAHALAVPWSVTEPVGPDERVEARRHLGLHPSDEVALYAGNLDAYQGWEDAVAALAQVARRRKRARLLVATASSPAALLREARRAGLGARMHIAPIATEADRRRAHAAADVAVVPRRAPGGLPIKLLDALARGVPTIATRRATAGLDLGRAVVIVADDDPEALSTAAVLAFATPDAMAELGARGRRHVRDAHAPSALAPAIDAIGARMGAPGALLTEARPVRMEIPWRASSPSRSTRPWT